MATTGGQHRADPSIERVAFFSDAVFAIALTLLAIDLRLPETVTVTSSSTFLAALAEVAPRLYGFALSFFVIILFWLGHYRTFRVVTEVDGVTIAANVVLLFFVVLLPFPTAVLGAHADIPAAVAFYGLCAGATGLASTGLWVVVAHVRHHVGSLPPDIARRITVRAALVPVILVASTPLAFVDTRLPLVIWVVIWPAQLVYERARGLHLDPHRQAEAARADRAKLEPRPPDSSP